MQLEDDDQFAKVLAEHALEHPEKGFDDLEDFLIQQGFSSGMIMHHHQAIYAAVRFSREHFTREHAD